MTPQKEKHGAESHKLSAHRAAEPVLGASAIKCCYAARGIRVSSTMTEIVEWANANMIFSNAKRIILDEKISPSAAAWSTQPAGPMS